MFKYAKLSLPTMLAVDMAFPERNWIGIEVQKGGISAYEPEEMATNLALSDLFEGVYYDIGANIGIYSIILASNFGRHCCAFEPTPELAAAIRDTKIRHCLPINVHEVALGDQRGEATLFLSKKASTSNSLNSEHREHVGEVKVPVVTLDEIVEEPPAILKIDVETFEPQVLAGAVKTIQQHQPIIVIEVLHKSRRAIEQFVRQERYVAYNITDEDLWPVTQTIQNSEKQGSTRNWVLAPRPLPLEFWSRLSYYRWVLKSTAFGS